MGYQRRVHGAEEPDCCDFLEWKAKMTVSHLLTRHVAKQNEKKKKKEKIKQRKPQKDPEVQVEAILGPQRGRHWATKRLRNFSQIEKKKNKILHSHKVHTTVNDVVQAGPQCSSNHHTAGLWIVPPIQPQQAQTLSPTQPQQAQAMYPTKPQQTQVMPPTKPQQAQAMS